MKKLFLCSSFHEVADLLANWQGNLRGKRVCFIPTASLVEKFTFYVKAGRKALERLGMLVEELELSKASKEEIHSALESCDVMYVSGGNTFYLLQELKRRAVDFEVVKQVLAGKLYIGESAGSMVCAKDIAYVQAMDSIDKAPQLNEYAALGLVDFYPVPHYNNFPFQKVAHEMVDNYNSSLAMLPLSNHEAIIVEDREYRLEAMEKKK